MKLALKYKPRPKIAEGFIQRRLDTRVDARLSALLEARVNLKAVLPGRFYAGCAGIRARGYKQSRR